MQNLPSIRLLSCSHQTLLILSLKKKKKDLEILISIKKINKKINRNIIIE